MAKSVEKSTTLVGYLPQDVPPVGSMISPGFAAGLNHVPGNRACCNFDQV